MLRASAHAIIILTSTVVMGVGAANSQTKSGWEELSKMNIAPAMDIFTSDLEATPADREAKLGAALALLNAQPRTRQKLVQVRSWLSELEPIQDDIGIAATYYLARLTHLHDYEPDPDKARRGYQQLLATHPGNPIAELAAPKLTILLLYGEASPTDWDNRVTLILNLLPGLRSQAAQRDTRLVLADALLKLRQDHQRAYPLLKYCYDANLVTRITRRKQLLLELAEASRTLGLTSEASTYYAKFLQEFPRDVASEEIRRRLNALPSESTL